MLNITCPSCGHNAPLESYAADADARRVAQLMGAVPPAIADLVLRYMALFAPRKHKVTMARARARLEPLVQAIQAQRIKHKGREWSAPVSTWEQALDVMLNQRTQLDLPLANHNYLFKVIVGIAEKSEAAAENQVEAQRRHGAAPASNAPALPTEAEQLGALRMRAITSATSWVMGQKRLKLPLTREGLQAELRKAGYTEDVIAFASDKVELPHG